MFFRYIIIILFQAILYPISAQLDNENIQIELNSEAADLIRNVFITGSCKNVDNMERSGSRESFGVFKNASDILGFSDGIILSTGDVRSAIGPNNSIATSTRFDLPSTDKDLVSIATDQLYDVTVLEFDFVPVGSQVNFQYVFASEEYCEFVGTEFNDVFGFFVSGPGINGPFADGAINVARLPVTGEEVSINNVNHGANQNSYVKNELTDDVAHCDIVYDPAQIETFEFDGFTVPLLARIPVIPCETYHIRLVIGDVGDAQLDSAVFLRSKSFDLGEIATIKASIPEQSDSIVYENCLDGQFIFTRPEGRSNNQPIEIGFKIDESSTATEGIDFATFSRNITIPAGQDSVILDITTLDDGQVENIEDLTLTLLSTICECQEGGSATLRISDASDPVISFDTIVACVGQPFSISPSVSNGVAPYQYRWQDNSSDSSLKFTILEPTGYSITVTDLCGKQADFSGQIGIQGTPSAELSGVIDYCQGLDDRTLPITFNGQPPWSFSYRVDNNNPITISDIINSDFELPISEAGNYELVAFSDAACIGEASGMGSVIDLNIDVGIEVVPLSCPDEEDAQIILDVQGSPPYDINWTPSVNNNLNPTNLPAGNYELFIKDAQDCEYIRTFNITGPIPLPKECERMEIYIPNVFTPDGDGDNDLFEIFLSEKTTITQITTVEIYDRWGNLVYLSENQLPAWDGTYNGIELSPALFVYKVQLEFDNGESQLLTGGIQLIK